MHVFVTGATGWVGSAVVDDLIGAGHQVTGLVRSEDKAAALAANGVRVVRGTLADIEVLQRAADAADAVVHTAFEHDFSRFAENCEQDRRVIEALGASLRGSARPLLVTSGLLGLAPGAHETDLPNSGSPRKSESAARALAEQGVRAATVRLAPSVHGLGDHGFVPILVRMAKQTGVSAYLGEGGNRWSGVHRRDAARVYRLALERGVTSPVYHAVADEAVAFKAIAETIGKRLGVPVESRDREHFGWFAMMAGADMSVSSAYTRELLDWTPQGPGLLADIDQPGYYAG
ncbi:SDR family oxidoreductase [Lysobacter capsici]|uniref:SDR family oxidoreductase n=1 Tax=Lysobacter capsici TaxID=435897 RepID=UPI00287BAF03|nr:SDR family oxidoreductase [Lysobacter capsici]WND81477.1 SDR family oxidoreductase [Lysobacter capsici]WND86673.1 SDR family oxidoreductase [Lysobacter capsici]